MNSCISLSLSLPSLLSHLPRVLKRRPSINVKAWIRRGKIATSPVMIMIKYNATGTFSTDSIDRFYVYKFIYTSVINNFLKSYLQILRYSILQFFSMIFS